MTNLPPYKHCPKVHIPSMDHSFFLSLSLYLSLSLSLSLSIYIYIRVHIHCNCIRRTIAMRPMIV